MERIFAGRVLALLKAREGSPCRGRKMSRALGVSRAAVWKAMESLRDEGYVISSAPRRGYALEGSPDRLSAGELAGALAGRRVGRALVCLETVDSTNNEVKRRALAGAADGLAVVAGDRPAAGAAGASPLSPLRGRGFICRSSSAPVPPGGGVGPDGVDGGGGVQCGGAGVRRAARDQVAKRRDPGRASCAAFSPSWSWRRRAPPCAMWWWGWGSTSPRPQPTSGRRWPRWPSPWPRLWDGPPPGGDGGGRAGRPGRAVRRLPGGAGGLAGGRYRADCLTPWAGRCACSGRAGRRSAFAGGGGRSPSPWWCAAPTAAGRRCPPARCPSGTAGVCVISKSAGRVPRFF